MAATALDVLRALHAHTTAHRLPPPAALIGDWWDADAVIAPSIELRTASGRPPIPTDSGWATSVFRSAPRSPPFPRWPAASPIIC